MRDANIMSYSLLHITSKDNYYNIIETKKIIPSKHIDDKIQWLGDGIYFWDSNDEMAIVQGKSLIRGRTENAECVGIIVEIEIDSNKHMNLEIRNWYQAYERFLKKGFPKYYEKILDYIDMIKNQSKVSTLNLNRVGKLTGKTINLFLDYLLKKEEIEIDMVSGYFFHGKNNSGNSFFRRYDRMIRQFCIKNTDLVNNKLEDWKIIESI